MIRKSVVLSCSPAAAFSLFVERAGEWWPLDRRHTDDARSTIHFEPSGRFYERACDGTEVDLGVVHIFEPSVRLVLDWFSGTGREQPTRVEIQFEPVDSGTRIAINHAPGSAGADVFERRAGAYSRSWDAVLSALGVISFGKA